MVAVPLDFEMVALSVANIDYEGFGGQLFNNSTHHSPIKIRDITTQGILVGSASRQFTCYTDAATISFPQGLYVHAFN
jgi:hypothetical protein